MSHVVVRFRRLPLKMQFIPVGLLACQEALLRSMLLLLAVLLLLGQALQCVGSYYFSMRTMLLGRVIYGLGGESMNVRGTLGDLPLIPLSSGGTDNSSSRLVPRAGDRLCIRTQSLSCPIWLGSQRFAVTWGRGTIWSKCLR